MEISTLVGNAELQHFSTQSEYSDPTSRATSSCHSDVLGDLMSHTYIKWAKRISKYDIVAKWNDKFDLK
jgi:hypothetical protein